MASNENNSQLINKLNQEWAQDPDEVEYELSNEYSAQPVKLQTSFK